ncbi:MAG: heat-inducible transcription repressor HrcA [Clostridia bacterium]|nr:heat-inducible transcription repressor HrcA [Clostridia bacterium]
MNLSERKKKILSAVVDESIRTAEPVSSKDVQEKYMKEFSPATIRNELMALEEMGFLSQPHTSAGRIPTAEGYKKYVEELMTVKKLSKKEADIIKDSFDEKLITLDNVLQKAARTISDATNYASVVYYGIGNTAIIDNILLIKLTKTNTLVVVVTDLGIIKQETKSINASEEDLRQASKILTDVFKGRKLDEIENNANLLTAELIRYKDIFDAIIHIITERGDYDKTMAVSGKDNLLNYPEYHDIDKLRKTISLLDKKDILYPLLTSNDGNLEISVKIGGDETLGVTDCSIVTASYKSNGKPIGTASVVGPVRMDYGKVVSILKNVTRLLEENIFDKKGDKR